MKFYLVVGRVEMFLYFSFLCSKPSKHWTDPIKIRSKISISQYLYLLTTKTLKTYHGKHISKSNIRRYKILIKMMTSIPARFLSKFWARLLLMHILLATLSTAKLSIPDLHRIWSNRNQNIWIDDSHKMYLVVLFLKVMEIPSKNSV